VYLYSLLTSTLDGVEWQTSHSGCIFPEKYNLITIELEASWIPKPVSALFKNRKFLAPAGIRSPDRPARG
jgi:hypothetical protein